MKLLNYLLGNYIINVAFLSWFIAQIIKFILDFAIHKRVNSERLVGSGGMPSSHSAFVCATTMGVAQVCNINSPEFAIALVFSAIVMFDAMGVRRAAGEQAKAINRLMDEAEKSGTLPDGDELKEYLGHTPMQVLAGALLGILVTIVYSY